MKKWIKAFIPPVGIFYIINGISRGWNPLEWTFPDYQVPHIILTVFFLFMMGLVIKYLILDVYVQPPVKDGKCDYFIPNIQTT